MRHMTIFSKTTLLGLGMVLIWIAHAAGAQIDPKLLGLWEMEIQRTPCNQGYRSIFEFRANGTSTLHDPAKGHAGTFTASGKRPTIADTATASGATPGTHAIRTRIRKGTETPSVQAVCPPQARGYRLAPLAATPRLLLPHSCVRSAFRVSTGYCHPPGRCRPARRAIPRSWQEARRKGS